MIDSQEVQSPEQLAGLVKAAGIRNLGPRGWENDKRPDLLIIWGAIDRKAYLRRKAQNDQTTALIVVPIESVKDMIGGAIEREGLSPDDVALCFSMDTKYTDSANRRAQMEGILILSPSDARLFTQSIRKNPKLFFSVIRDLNDGPLITKGPDERPPEIAGRSIKIMGNSKFRGDIPPSQSTPFPSNHNFNEICFS